MGMNIHNTVWTGGEHDVWLIDSLVAQTEQLSSHPQASENAVWSIKLGALSRVRKKSSHLCGAWKLKLENYKMKT